MLVNMSDSGDRGTTSAVRMAVAALVLTTGFAVAAVGSFVTGSAATNQASLGNPLNALLWWIVAIAPWVAAAGIVARGLVVRRLWRRTAYLVAGTTWALGAGAAVAGFAYSVSGI
jgi:hypothetical protein